MKYQAATITANHETHVDVFPHSQGDPIAKEELFKRAGE
jgi:hypothetical protein